MADMEEFRAWAVTHAGTVRSHNEDAFVNSPDVGVWAVADGAGGHAAGEVASDMIVQSLASIPGGLAADEMLAQVRLRVTAAHVALRERALQSGDGRLIATTVVVLIARQGHYACLWAGDSRAYLLRDGTLIQLTHDHSLVQELVDTGQIAETEAESHPRANVITRAVGADVDTFDLDKVTGRLAVGDRFLLCSDGLFKALSTIEIGEILTDAGCASPADALIEAALSRAARDNVTVIVLDVLQDGGEEPKA